jgi:hypothetical protein
MSEKDVVKNGETFVSFRWMLAQTLSLIISIVVIGFMIIGSVNKNIDAGLLTKVNVDKFEERAKSLEKADSDICKLLGQFADDKAVTNNRLGLIEQHLAILVGKPLSKSKDSRNPQ